jgi:hypothetical protein
MSYLTVFPTGKRFPGATGVKSHRDRVAISNLARLTHT